MLGELALLVGDDLFGEVDLLLGGDLFGEVALLVGGDARKPSDLVLGTAIAISASLACSVLSI